MTTPLPPARNPFPVKLPFQVRSDLHKLGRHLLGEAETHLFHVDAEYDMTVRERLRILQQHPAYGRVYMDDDLPGLRAALWQVAAAIAADQPEYARCDGDHFTSKLLGLRLSRADTLAFDQASALFPELGTACYAHLQPLTPFERLCDVLALSVQEDLVIGRFLPDDAGDVTECLLVTLPSKWSPRAKVGLSFAGVHAPVPHNERLLAAAPRLVQAMLRKGPYVRYNWTLSSVHLAQDPAIFPEYAAVYAVLNNITDPDQLLAQVHLRVERQTITALPHHRYLFAIHTYQRPLRDALTTDERRQTLAAFIETLPPAMRTDHGALGGVYQRLAATLAH